VSQHRHLDEAGECPRLELLEVVERDVEVVKVSDALKDILLHLSDPVVTDVQSPERNCIKTFYPGSACLPSLSLSLSLRVFVYTTISMDVTNNT
jgi:hypothetical protein